MTSSYVVDAIVVGSGPSGVAACFPLVEAGLRVLLLDGGESPGGAAPGGDFLSWRFNDREQWRRIIGEDFRALAYQEATSPKMRVPGLAYVFDGFLEANRIATKDFVAIGSLAIGGLSAAWGCGIARVDQTELATFPFDPEVMLRSYARVARRIGISGATDDDLRDFFGVDEWAQPPIALDPLHESLHRAYTKHRSRLLTAGFRLGRSRVAALAEDHGGRLACNRSANCLWGCERRSLYNAADELAVLAGYPSFSSRHGCIVESVQRENGTWAVRGTETRTGGHFTYSAKRVLMAAGTLATTRIVLDALRSRDPVPLVCAPMAAFLLWLPRFSGRAAARAFGLGQLSYSIDLPGGDGKCFGSTFSTTGIPVAEFASRVPMGRRYAVDVLRALLPSCLVGNAFLPGRFSAATARLDRGGGLTIVGQEDPRARQAMGEVAKKLRSAYLRLGAVLMPGSFTVGAKGGDIHYAATLPMRREPGPRETSSLGELRELPGLHVVDAACLPNLSGKSHTLTAMANADRIAANVASLLRGV